MSALKGKTVITTRPAEMDDTISLLLENEGVEVISFPMIRILGTRKSPKKNKMLSTVHSFDYVVFTSKNGVKYFFSYLKKLPGIKTISENINFISIGEKTSAEIRKNCRNTILTAKGNTSDELLEELKDKNIHAKNILFCMGTLASNKLEKELSKNNHTKRVNLYKTQKIKDVSAKTIELIKNGMYNVILFTSPSAIDNFVEIFKGTDYSGYKIACIGETTGQRAKNYKIRPVLISSKAHGEIFANELKQWLIKN